MSFEGLELKPFEPPKEGERITVNEEGAFRKWGYKLAKEEFRDICVTEDELWEKYNGEQAVGNGAALFEATHGSAPKYAGQDKVNPSSVILSGTMMFRYLGWNETADLIEKGIKGAIAAKRVTYDLARQMEGATTVKCSEFGQEIIKHMED
ncbi:MAG: hypothetical protein J7K01_01415 [Thermovirga sp.]|nr:hypothetical protein [Thermovirga sp.]